MQVRYRVHSSSLGAIETPATLPDGQAVDAKVQGLTVELIEVGSGNTITRRFVPEDITAAFELFAPGAEIVATFTAAPTVEE